MGEKKRTLRGFLCAALGGVCWGASGTVGQYLFTCQGVDSGWLTVVRMFLAGVVLLGGALVRHRPQLRAIWSDRRDALRLVLFSVGGLMTCQYTYLAAIRYSNSATATVLQYMGQALILLWVCLRARRLPTRREGAALVLALLGAFLLATHGSLTALALSPQALFWGLCAAVSLMLYTLLPGDLLRRYPVSVCTGCGMFIGGVVLQFCGVVLWLDVDYMLVVMPPGTGDVALNVFQTLPVDGVIIVASPQELVSMVVQKAVKMAQIMNIPIVGLVENMSYVQCPDCGKKLYIFGEGKTEEAAKEYHIPLLAKMPIDPALAKLTDDGCIEQFEGHWLDSVVETILRK